MRSRPPDLAREVDFDQLADRQAGFCNGLGFRLFLDQIAPGFSGIDKGFGAFAGGVEAYGRKRPEREPPISSPAPDTECHVPRF